MCLCNFEASMWDMCVCVPGGRLNYIPNIITFEQSHRYTSDRLLTVLILSIVRWWNRARWWKQKKTKRAKAVCWCCCSLNAVCVECAKKRFQAVAKIIKITEKPPTHGFSANNRNDLLKISIFNNHISEHTAKSTQTHVHILTRIISRIHSLHPALSTARLISFQARSHSCSNFISIKNKYVKYVEWGTHSAK